MRYFGLLTAILLWAGSCQAKERWAVYYGTSLPASAFAPYDVVVLDSEYSEPVDALKAQGKTVLGYISFGEAESYRSYYQELKAKDILLKKNKEWKDHVVIDVRKPAWKEYLISTLIPQTLSHGFDGVMFDTVDSPLHIGSKTEEEKIAMGQASVSVICDVHKAFPDMKIMVNRGFDILPKLAPCIDMLLAESTYTDLRLGSSKKPRRVNNEEYNGYVDIIKQAQIANPVLKVYTLDYWSLKDKKGVKGIYAAQRAQGFVPYVSTIDLQQLHSEPE